jgi:hypothetical protein
MLTSPFKLAKYKKHWEEYMKGFVSSRIRKMNRMFDLISDNILAAGQVGSFYLSDHLVHEWSVLVHSPKLIEQQG